MPSGIEGPRRDPGGNLQVLDPLDALAATLPPLAASPATSPIPMQGGDRPLARARFVRAGGAGTLVLLGGPRLLREVTASLLNAQPGIQVLGTFESATHFLAAGLEPSPALLLLDCDDGEDAGGFAGAVRVLSSAGVQSRVVLLCHELCERVVRCVIEQEGGGIILKSYSTKEIRAILSYVATGHTVMPGGWQRALCPHAPGARGLSPRHREILALIAQGRGNREIAAELDLSPNTIKFHVRAIYARLGVRNRVEAADQYEQMTSGGD
jgi:DNA-binding NarL/FixJ family response regulator